MTHAYVWRKTGEHRPPLKGESFATEDRRMDTARFSFEALSFDILRGEKVLAKTVAHSGDPCIHCGQNLDHVPPGPCRGLVFMGVLLDEEEIAT